jgi:hypothetical protein
MSLDIPSNIEREIEQFAQQQRITTNEAAIRLIERGLSLGTHSQKTAPAGGLGLFSSAEDAAILDEVVAIAYEERRRPSKSETTH